MYALNEFNKADYILSVSYSILYFLPSQCIMCDYMNVCFFVFQFSAHGGVLGNAGSPGCPGSELAHCIQRCW